MNKTELIDQIAAKAGLTKADSKKALDATIDPLTLYSQNFDSIDAIKEALVAGDKVALIGFGTFSVNTRAAREGINPRDKVKIQIPEKKIAKFKAGADLVDALK